MFECAATAFTLTLTRVTAAEFGFIFAAGLVLGLIARTR